MYKGMIVHVIRKQLVKYIQTLRPTIVPNGISIETIG